MELVKVENGQILTSSLVVAEIFGKEHKNVLRDIENVISSGSNQDFNRLNFEPIEYLDGRKRKQKAYALTKNAFSLIAMGFTGKEAIDWKIKYINAFEQMEAKLKSLGLNSFEISDPIKRAEKWIEEQKEKLLLENKVENLSTALDSLVEWTSIIKVCQFNKVKENCFKWQTLKKKSEELGYEVKKAESRRFDYQNLYHINVFKACYPQYKYDFLNK